MRTGLQACLCVRLLDARRAQAELLASTSGVQLPADFVSAAESGGLRRSVLDSYISLQVCTAFCSCCRQMLTH